jgi:hypothetical protein
MMRAWNEAERAAIAEVRATKCKVKVRQLATKHKRRGTLQPQPCEVCGSPEVQMHHDNYNKPLDVRWLCTTHHGIAHRRVRAPDTGSR